jgi:hypothetical protein
VDSENSEMGRSFAMASSGSMGSSCCRGMPRAAREASGTRKASSA